MSYRRGTQEQRNQEWIFVYGLLFGVAVGIIIGMLLTIGP